MCEIPCPRCSHGRPMLLLQKVQVSTFGRLPPQEALTSLERSRGWFQKWNRGQLSPESMRARPLEGPPLRALELIDGAALASFSNNGDCRSYFSVHVTNPYPSPFYWIMYVHVDIHKFCHMEWLPSNGSSNTGYSILLLIISATDSDTLPFNVSRCDLKEPLSILCCGKRKAR